MLLKLSTVKEQWDSFKEFFPYSYGDIITMASDRGDQVFLALGVSSDGKASYLSPGSLGDAIKKLVQSQKFSIQEALEEITEFHKLEISESGNYYLPNDHRRQRLSRNLKTFGLSSGRARANSTINQLLLAAKFEHRSPGYGKGRRWTDVIGDGEDHQIYNHMASDNLRSYDGVVFYIPNQHVYFIADLYRNTVMDVPYLSRDNDLVTVSGWNYEARKCMIFLNTYMARGPYAISEVILSAKKYLHLLNTDVNLKKLDQASKEKFVQEVVYNLVGIVLFKLYNMRLELTSMDIQHINELIQKL